MLFRSIELIGRFRRQCVDHILDRTHESRVVDPGLHRVDIEEPSLVVGMLGVSRGAAFEEVESKAAPALGRIEIAIGILPGDLFAFEELGDFLHLLPGVGNAPVA